MTPQQFESLPQENHEVQQLHDEIIAAQLLDKAQSIINGTATRLPSSETVFSDNPDVFSLKPNLEDLNTQENGIPADHDCTRCIVHVEACTLLQAAKESSPFADRLSVVSQLKELVHGFSDLPNTEVEALIKEGIAVVKAKREAFHAEPQTTDAVNDSAQEATKVVLEKKLPDHILKMKRGIKSEEHKELPAATSFTSKKLDEVPLVVKASEIIDSTPAQSTTPVVTEIQTPFKLQQIKMAEVSITDVPLRAKIQTATIQKPDRPLSTAAPENYSEAVKLNIHPVLNEMPYSQINDLPPIAITAPSEVVPSIEQLVPDRTILESADSNSPEITKTVPATIPPEMPDETPLPSLLTPTDQQTNKVPPEVPPQQVIVDHSEKNPTAVITRNIFTFQDEPTIFLEENIDSSDIQVEQPELDVNIDTLLHGILMEKDNEPGIETEFSDTETSQVDEDNLTSFKNVPDLSTTVLTTLQPLSALREGTVLEIDNDPIIETVNTYSPAIDTLIMPEELNIPDDITQNIELDSEANDIKDNKPSVESEKPIQNKIAEALLTETKKIFTKLPTIDKNKRDIQWVEFTKSNSILFELSQVLDNILLQLFLINNPDIAKEIGFEKGAPNRSLLYRYLSQQQAKEEMKQSPQTTNNTSLTYDQFILYIWTFGNLLNYLPFQTN